MMTKKHKPYKARTKEQEFYRNKYFIALYNIHGYCDGIYDNARVMAQTLNKSIDTVYSMLSRAYARRDTDNPYTLRLDGKLYGIYFIPAEDD